MDLSKLPKLSDSSEAPPPNGVEHDSSIAEKRKPRDESSQVRSVFENLIGVAVGLILISLGRSFAGYAWATMRGETFHTQVTWQTGARINQEVSYWELQGYTGWTDTGLFLFGIALLVDVAAKLLRASLGGIVSDLFVALALLFTVMATVFNAWTCVKVWSAGITPILSLLFAVYGAYIAYEQMDLLRRRAC